jgi:predicted Zn finger-like uncharacterized protein
VRDKHCKKGSYPMTDSSRIIIECPSCAADIVIDRGASTESAKGPGGVVLKCSHCDHVFHFYLEGNVSGARVTGGAELLEVYYDRHGNKADVLKRHGLSAEV